MASMDYYYNLYGNTISNVGTYIPNYIQDDALASRIESVETAMTTLKLDLAVKEAFIKGNIKFVKTDSRAEIPSIKGDGTPTIDISCIDFDYDEKDDVYIYHTGLNIHIASDCNAAFIGLLKMPDSVSDSYISNDKVLIQPRYKDSGYELVVRYKNRESLKQQRMIISLCNRVARLENKKDIDDGLDDAWWKKYAISKAPFKAGDTICQLLLTNFAIIRQETKTMPKRNSNGLLQGEKRL